MKAFLLAAGLGTRLRPVTEHTPKCLVPVQGKPLLHWWLDAMEKLGVTEVLINTHYFAEQVESYIAKLPTHLVIKLVHETELLGTLGSVKNNATFLDNEDFLLVHADNFCVTDWHGFTQAFYQRPSTCHMLMMLFDTQAPESCGMVSTDDEKVVCDYVEKPKTQVTSHGANAAVFICSPETLQRVLNTPNDSSDFCRDFVPQQMGRIFTWHNHHVHIDIGTPSRLQEANQLDLQEEKRLGLF